MVDAAGAVSVCQGRSLGMLLPRSGLVPCEQLRRGVFVQVRAFFADRLLNLRCQRRLMGMGKRARQQNRAARRVVDTPSSALSAAVAVARPRPVDPLAESLQALEKGRELERSILARRAVQVGAARDAGASWTSIARALGVSPQAVQQRYGSRS
jgi:hypothetical protein